MDHLTLGLIILSGFLAWNTISDLKTENRELKNRLDRLADVTGHKELSSSFVNESLKYELLILKNKGEDIRAIKLLRSNTGMDLLNAKQYIDALE